MGRKVHIWIDSDLLEEYRKYKPETKGLTYTALVEMIVRERLAELSSRWKSPNLEVGVESEA